MCDYSLCGLPTRLAVEGEELVVHRFSTGSMGLASPADLKKREPVPAPMAKGFWASVKRFFAADPPEATTPAVCIPPGAHLMLKNIPPDLQHQYHLQAEEPVVFVQTSANPHVYRDAVQFGNGRQVLLQYLRQGVVADVLSLEGVEVLEEERQAVLR